MMKTVIDTKCRTNITHCELCSDSYILNLMIRTMVRMEYFEDYMNKIGDYIIKKFEELDQKREE